MNQVQAIAIQVADQADAASSARPESLAAAPAQGALAAVGGSRPAANDGGFPSGTPGARLPVETFVEPEETLAFASPSGKLRAEISAARAEGGWVAGSAYQSLRGAFYAERSPTSAEGKRFPSREAALESALKALEGAAEADESSDPSPEALRDLGRLAAWIEAKGAELAAAAEKAREASALPLAGATFVDLFAGIGGFHSALKGLGAKCVAAVELDAAAAATYKANHGSDFLFRSDIRDLDASELPPTDIVSGGFPCPDFSIAGDQAGFAGSSGALYFDAVRVVKAARPKLVLFENVAAIATHDGGRTLAKAMDLLARAGYVVSVKTLDASDFGLPQQRRRIFIVGRRVGLPAANDPFFFPEGSGADATVEDILEKRSKEPAAPGKMTAAVAAGAATSGLVLAGLMGGKNMQGYRVYDPKGKGATLCATSGGPGRQTALYLVGGKPRRLTARECARMQGFPDSFVLDPSPNQARKQFGNAVAVPVVAALAKAAAGCL